MVYIIRGKGLVGHVKKAKVYEVIPMSVKSTSNLFGVAWVCVRLRVIIKLKSYQHILTVTAYSHMIPTLRSLHS